MPIRAMPAPGRRALHGALVMDAVIYMRWSSAAQREGSTLQRQREDCRRHAREKGWDVIAELVDDGVSAFRGKHVAAGELSRFVAEAHAGAYAHGVVLLVEKLDRLSREGAAQAFTWMVEMTKLGVAIATVEGDKLYTRDNLDIQVIIEVIVKAEAAYDESFKKSGRLERAWAIKRSRLVGGEKLVLTRRAPAWLAVDGDPARFVVIPERAEIVRRIFEETTAGFGKHHIARNLNLEGVPTFGRAEGWHASYVQKILSSPAVLGEFQPGQKSRGGKRRHVGDAIPDYYPRIVDPDLHASAMRSMAGRQRRSIGRGRRLVNLFSGLATCGACASRMTFRSKGLKSRADGSTVNEDYLICDSYQRGRGCGNGHHFNYAVWEDGVLDAILYDALEDKHFASPEVVRPLEIELAELERRCAADRVKADTALALFVETQRPEVKEMWAGLASAVDGHEAAIDTLRKRVVAARGVVSPEEHQRRIGALRASLRHDDEQVRFSARSRVMEAFHDLVESMTFSASPLGVNVVTAAGVDIWVAWEDWGGDRKGTSVEKWMPR